MVPSISETTTLSELSHTKMRAVQAITPDADSENVILFGPLLRLRFFYRIIYTSIFNFHTNDL